MPPDKRLQTKLNLTPEILDQILFAMEDQDNTYVFDMSTGKVVVPQDDVGSFLPLPQWSSSQGFQLMREFAFTLGNPSLKADLNRILDSGQGVFKGFKAALKAHPRTAAAWHRYKLQNLIGRVQSWAKEWEEVWDLESLRLPEEDTRDLVSTDFEIQPPLSPNEWKDLEEAWARELSQEESWPSGALWLKHRRSRRPWNPGDRSWVVRDGQGDVLGVLAAMTWQQDSLSVWTVEVLYILPELRSLGLAKALLERCIDEGRLAQVWKMELPLPGSAGFLDETLKRMDFTAQDRIWTLCLGEDDGEDLDEGDF